MMLGNRPPSPMTIRRRAALAIRQNVRNTLPPPPARPADGDETPLSAAEIQHGIHHGLLREVRL